ncbi:MAG: phosphatidylserine decarboxylase [Helicobacteraceae bacterium]|jgi:phosphatidylserine decarboxylase|nr:phosphatidylserine decarboxylase [Helicobacteraceae bacterium]
MSFKYVSSGISRLFGRFASKARNKRIQRFINGVYVKALRIDMGEFEAPRAYPTLNALFTRALKNPRDMPSEQNAIISPCDSLITQMGAIENNTLFQIKGMPYSLYKLLPYISKENLTPFEGGYYSNFYLSPRDYHRYHAPIALKLTKLTHIPGKLLPVNMPFLRHKLNLFCENERAILEGIDINDKRWILVFVGALNVGKMRFAFKESFQTNINAMVIKEFNIDLSVKRGDLLGWFEMGSTVVLISQKEAAQFTIELNRKVKFGDPIGKLETKL